MNSATEFTTAVCAKLGASATDTQQLAQRLSNRFQLLSEIVKAARTPEGGNGEQPTNKN